MATPAAPGSHNHDASRIPPAASRARIRPPAMAVRAVLLGVTSHFDSPSLLWIYGSQCHDQSRIPAGTATAGDILPPMGDMLRPADLDLDHRSTPGAQGPCPWPAGARFGPRPVPCPCPAASGLESRLLPPRPEKLDLPGRQLRAATVTRIATSAALGRGPAPVVLAVGVSHPSNPYCDCHRFSLLPAFYRPIECGRLM